MISFILIAGHQFLFPTSSIKRAKEFLYSSMALIIVFVLGKTGIASDEITFSKDANNDNTEKIVGGTFS